MLKRRISKASPYGAKQLYALVADVESYPQFLPWCLAVKIIARREDGFSAEVTVGNQLVFEKFISHNTLKPAAAAPSWLIEARSEQPPFRVMENYWRFTPRPSGSKIDFSIDMEFESSLKGRLFGGVFVRAVDKMVAAFERRAERLYGF